MGVQDEDVSHVQGTMGGCGKATLVTAEKEQQAHAAIIRNLSDSQLMHVITATTAGDAWGGLAKFHHTQDMASRLWIKEQL